MLRNESVTVAEVTAAALNAPICLLVSHTAQKADPS